MSDFESKILQRVRFCFEIFLKTQILLENVHSKSYVLTEYTPYSERILHFLCGFKKHDSDAKNIFEKQVF